MIGLACLCGAVLIAGLLISRFVMGKPNEPQELAHVAPIVDGNATPAPIKIEVPFVGCPSDGQGGPVSAPKGKSRTFDGNRDEADRLAYYSSGSNFGVLAPRGWHCYGSYGSSGTSLYVSPQAIDREHFLADNSKFSGPIVQLQEWDGGTSGRFEVAKVVARMFPEHRDFLQKVIDEGVEPEALFPASPYDTYLITRRSSELV